MRCLEKDRTRRYETASALAADVAAVPGRRAGRRRARRRRAYRLRKFARRNKAALATGAVIGGRGAGGRGRAGRQHTSASARKRRDKEAALAEAEANLLLARRAVDEMYTDVADQLDVAAPHAAVPARRDAEGAAVLPGVRPRKSTDPAIRVEAARRRAAGAPDSVDAGSAERERTGCPRRARGAGATGRRVAGRPRSAAWPWPRPMPSWAASLDQRRPARGGGAALPPGRGPYVELAAQYPVVPDYRRRLAAITNTLGSCLRGQDRPREAEECHREAIRLSEQLAAELPTEVLYRGELVNSYYQLGYMLVRGAQRGQARGRLPAGHRHLREGWRAAGPVHLSRRYTPGSMQELGRLLAAGGRAEEAERAYRQAVDSAGKLTCAVPRHPPITGRS